MHSMSLLEQGFQAKLLLFLKSMLCQAQENHETHGCQRFHCPGNKRAIRRLVIARVQPHLVSSLQQ